MRSLTKYFLLFFLLGTIYCLNRNWNSFPALGKFLDPYHGCWQNASPETQSKVTYDMKGLSSPVEVRFDERLVPHIFAKNNLDAIFIQGYLHAKFRLWQMDMTTRFASGRLSEVIGDKTLNVDKDMRRKGMVYGAENSLKVMEADPESKQTLDAYCMGVNSYILTLRYKTFPLEYKLMGFEPELWSNLKTSLMIKFMADKLSGHTEDFELTMAKKLFGSNFEILYPEHLDEEYPVVGGGQKTAGSKQDSVSSKQYSVNSKQYSVNSRQSAVSNKQQAVYSHNQISDTSFRTSNIEHRKSNLRHRASNIEIGSNNWALSGSKTVSGKPILCNDPHLPLNLPAIWYENQIITPTMNVYGVSLPGTPQVVIGFNDSIAWGFTNGYRDVKDFYSIQFKDATKKEYLLDGKYLPSDIHIETIKVKGQPDILDTVAYTKMGIVMYDASFPKKGFEGQNFAVNWMAHRGSNELKALTKLNESKNYDEFVLSIQHFHCPHQNFVFAAANGDIAMWSQGLFIYKKQDEGRFVQEGNTLQYQWKHDLPEMDNPHELNPSRGYVMSANQVNTSRDYPFYYNGIFTEERAKRLTHLLSASSKYSVQDMMKMQNDTYWQNASEILPVLMAHLSSSALSDTQRQLLNKLKQWDFLTTPDSKMPVLFSLWFDELQKDIYDDEFGSALDLLDYPKERVTLQLLTKHPDFIFFDDIGTPQKENIDDIIQKSFIETENRYTKMKETDWYKFKQTTADHLSKIPAFSVKDIQIGGGHGIINAATAHTGPSWRMIVHFTDPIEAYGIYPGGESGNVASPFYTSMIDDWAKGTYYRLHFAHKPNDIP